MKKILIRPALTVMALLGILTANSCGQNNATLKTYTNTAFHYQIDYPIQWKAEGTAQNIAESLEMTFYTEHVNAAKEKDMTMITVRVYKNPNLRSPKNWYLLDSHQQSDGIYPYPAKIVAHAEETTANGYPAYKITTNDQAGSYDYFIGSKTAIYRISFEKFQGDSSIPQETFEQVLRSFKITN